MLDETGHIRKPEGTVTSETLTKSSGPIVAEPESVIGGVSVRGWIALIACCGIVIALAGASFGQISKENESLVTMLAGLLGGIISVYIGQSKNMKGK